MSRLNRSDQFVEVIESQVGQWVRFEVFDESERERHKLQGENLSLRGSCKELGARLTRAEENLKKARKERDKNHAKRCALRDEIAIMRTEVDGLHVLLKEAGDELKELKASVGFRAHTLDVIQRIDAALEASR